MGKLYKVWADSKSLVEMPADEAGLFESLDKACDLACDLAHAHDGMPYRAIFHVEDVDIDETIDTFENTIFE